MLIMGGALIVMRLKGKAEPYERQALLGERV